MTDFTRDPALMSVLVTGTSSGIGQATALALAKRGWRVFATMRNTDKKEPLENALIEAGVRDHVEIGQAFIRKPVWNTDVSCDRAYVVGIPMAAWHAGRSAAWERNEAR